MSENLPPGTDWDSWLGGLDEGRCRFAVTLRERLVTLGADSPEDWTRSEVNSDIAHPVGVLAVRDEGRRYHPGP